VSKIIPTVLSGGSGTRLWPLSRTQYPKQFVPYLTGETSSLIDATLRRIGGEAAFAAPIVICNNDHRFLVADALAQAGADAQAIILEPVGRNTAPAVAVAALQALQSGDDAVLAVLPSDHLVRNERAFIAGVTRAASIAATGRLVLFGIAPTNAHTGYGYIKRGAPLADAPDAHAVAAFVEKPDLPTAETYLAAGDYLWNSGIFVLHARTVLAELERLAPDVLEAARAALDGAKPDLQFLRLDAAAFERAPKVSIDTAVMEKTDRAAMLPLVAGWSDVGSWSSLWEVTPHDDHGNAVRGDAILTDTSGCYVHSPSALVTTIGVKDLVIVDTSDAVLVADKSRAQDVAGLVELLKQSNRREHAQHLRSHRPWGYYETLSLSDRFQVKLLHVKPGGRLSKQMHHHRSEHWVVVRGTAQVTIGETERLVHENESVYITAGQWHRLANPGKLGLEIIEVQIGSYLEEDDIIRCDDVYNRAPGEKS
jgi:mannose-1-phosphate guanylyltransferase / mannose-6-phosphate isomerase